MQYLHTNNASSNLRDAITSVSQPTIVVTSGQGTLFPNPGFDQGFFVTVEDRRTGRLEIMLCTARTGDTLTVTRGQQGTVPQTFAVGVSVANRVTAEILNQFVSATVDVIPLARIPPIPSSQLISVDGAKVVGPGKVALAALPAIPSSQITSLDAAKLTGTMPSAVLPNPLPAANLPVIPSSKLTSVPAASLTGTIDPLRLPVIPSSLLTSVPAASLTGTINEARFPTAFSITGGIGCANLTTSGNVSIGGAITAVDSLVATGRVEGNLVHRQDGGYVYVGAYDTATHGSGAGRIYYTATTQRYTFLGHTSDADLSIGGFYHGNGSLLSGIPEAYVDVAAGGVGSLVFARCTSARTFGSTVSGSSLRTNNASGSNSADGGSLAGTWRCLGHAPDDVAGSGTTLWMRIS